MIARITRILLVIQAIVAIALATFLSRRGAVDHIAIALILGFAAVALFRLAIVANNFFLSWSYRSETPSRFLLGKLEMWQLFKEEFKASMTTSSWTMPFRTFSKRVADHPEGYPVLLVHGYGANSGYWTGLSKALQRANVTHHAIDMEPVFCSIEVYAEVIHEAVEQLRKETGQDRIIIVAHSMGGLAARAYLRAYGSTSIARIITIGTPHHGTGLASFGPGENSRQMRRRRDQAAETSKDWLSQLDKSENAQLRSLFVSIYSHHDNIVSPQLSSHLDGAKNIEFHGIGHVALASHPKILATVIDEIRLASRQDQVFLQTQTDHSISA